jgi:hypothetical protein
MRTRFMCVIVGALVAAACSSPTSAQTKPATASMPAHAMPMTQDEMIKTALSAGPSDIAARAAVVDMTADGKMKEIRKGTNGWVCMAHPEAMCIDKEWQAFFDAYMNKKEPRIKAIGVGYMLRGEQIGVSNTDPFAPKPTPTNEWVISPPHVMILTPDMKQLDALPADFRSGGPWVMWKGTKYAHIMVPTTAMGK